MGHDPDAERCLRLLRRHRAGTLGFGERRAAVAFVLDPADGRVVMPVEPGAAAFEEFVLYLPSECDCDATALLAPATIDRPESSAEADRWAAYHGPAPAAAVWTASRVLGVKSEHDAADTLMDEHALTVANELGRDEGRLIRAANADRVLLAAAVRAIAGADAPAPLCVGADAHGVDVRAPFGIIRLEFPERAADAAHAERMLREAILSRGARP